MDQREFHKHLQRSIAQRAVGASAIRNQGAGGLLKICRDYFELDIELKDFFDSLSDEFNYNIFLDKHTDAIVDRFPVQAKSWGAARKGLNLFFREVCYNKYFADLYKLPTGFKSNNVRLKFLEVPLDNDVAMELHNHFPNQLPKWNGIRKLTKVNSIQYQEKAQDLATLENIARVHLDLVFWRKKTNDK